MKFYAANRRGFSPDKQWTLLLENPFPERSHGALCSHRNDFSADDILNHVNQLYPDGLSPHGWHYWTARYGAPCLQDGNQGIPNAPAIELTFEYVRRSFFPDRPSRLQSYFAYSSQEEVERIYPEFPHVTIDSEDYFKADQTWLNISYQIAVAEFNAHRYWSGDASAKPKWEFIIKPPFKIEPLR